MLLLLLVKQERVLKGEESFPKVQCFLTLRMIYKMVNQKIHILLSDPTDQVPVLNCTLHELQSSIMNLMLSMWTIGMFQRLT